MVYRNNISDHYGFAILRKLYNTTIAKLVFATRFVAEVPDSLDTVWILYLSYLPLSGYGTICGAVCALFTDIVLFSILLVVIQFLELFALLDERITRNVIIRLCWHYSSSFLRFIFSLRC